MSIIIIIVVDVCLFSFQTCCSFSSTETVETELRVPLLRPLWHCRTSWPLKQVIRPSFSYLPLYITSFFMLFSFCSYSLSCVFVLIFILLLPPPPSSFSSYSSSLSFFSVLFFLSLAYSWFIFIASRLSLSPVCVCVCVCVCVIIPASCCLYSFLDLFFFPFSFLPFISSSSPDHFFF